jgi:pantetheine-phosphate adenylyltransferase
MSNKAIYPGTFDPITFGHLDIIKRANCVFDEVIIAVAQKSQKNPLFTIDERIEMIEECTKDIPGVTVEAFDGLVVNFAKQRGVNVLLRGLRMMSDFEFELQMALTNRRLDDTVETMFLMPSEGYAFTSSSLLKEVAALGADLSSFVPDLVEKRVKGKLKARND